MTAEDRNEARRWGAPARAVAGASAALLLLLVLPDTAGAWGPGTHLYLGTEILRHLDVLGPGAAALLATRPRAFLYGMLAPDFLVAKDRAPPGLHSHLWERADEVRRAAEGTASREAAALGYQAHLAADVVAHGLFLPRRLVVTASTRAIGHSYWEHRVEAALPDRFAEEARALVPDHEDGPVEELFREVLTPTVFSFETNRRIYREMVRWSSHANWQTVFGHLVDRSRWSLEAREQGRALDLSVSLCVDVIRRGEDSPVRGLDPIGEAPLERAKEVRRRTLRSGPWRPAWEDTERLERAAERHFPLPCVRGPADPVGPDRVVEAYGEAVPRLQQDPAAA